MTKEEMNELLLAANNYYNGHPIVMTDKEYDELLAKAKAENPEFNIFKMITIGGDATSVRHIYPFTPQEFKAQFVTADEFRTKTSNLEGWYVTPKWDGCSIRATYSNGQLIDIVTRSDEQSGKRKYDQLKNKVPNLVDSRVLCIDFEALCSFDDYGSDTRSNANGLVNSKNADKQKEIDKNLQLVPFKVTPNSVMDYYEAMRLVFKDDEFIILHDFDPSCRKMLFQGKSYPIDGYVFYKDTVIKHKIYKHYYEQTPSTTVRKVGWNFTDKLCFVPTLEFDTVRIDGRNISRAATNGYGRLRSLKAGVGSEVTIMLINSTIPGVKKVIVPSENYGIPKGCPFCGSPLKNVNNKLRCSNDFCTKIVDVLGRKFIRSIDPRIPAPKFENINQVKEFFRIMNKEFNDEEVITRFIKSLPFERFSKAGALAKSVLANIDKLIDGSFKDVNIGVLTAPQKAVFNCWIPILDELIHMITNKGAL